MKAKPRVKKNIPKKSPPPKTVRNSFAGFNSYYILGGILLLTFLLFYNTLTNNFVNLDDSAHERLYNKPLSGLHILYLPFLRRKFGIRAYEFCFVEY